MGGRRRCRGDEARGWQVGPQRRQPIILFLLSLMTVEQVTVSSKGQITIPKALRDMLSLSPGAKLSVSVRGPEIVLSKEQAWKSLRGAGAVYPLIAGLEDERRRNREREDRP